jgi:predicted GNAT family acetyltransferase
MRVVRHADGNAFLTRATPFLARAEAENNIILSVAAASGGAASNDNYFATVEDGDAVVACAIRTPPSKALLSRAGAAAMRLLIGDLIARYDKLPAVLGPEPAVRVFAELWAARTGLSAREGMRQRLFEARQVVPLDRRPSGAIRFASDDDEDIITAWMEAFIREVALDNQYDPRRMARARINDGSIFVWDDGGPVSMAGWAGRTKRGVRVNFVYTPPEARGSGYASACVADLTERLLAKGAEFCCLVTDLANPTSNSIYQRIGYSPVCDFTDFHLDE